MVRLCVCVWSLIVSVICWAVTVISYGSGAGGTALYLTVIKSLLNLQLCMNVTCSEFVCVSEYSLRSKL